MADLLSQINTIVLLMFENRSFDHMLGHLSFENKQPKAEGLKEPLTQYVNVYEGDEYIPYPITNDTTLPFDLPHEFDEVDIQLKKGANGKFTMAGFVEAYAKSTNVPPNRQTEPMSFFPSALVPMTSFLASNFCVCNRWFTSLPTSTQPNRTMAFTGESAIYQTKFQAIPATNNIFQWMDQNSVRWRVYHDGLSFFALYPSLWPYVLGNQFRDYEFFFRDMATESDDTAPQVIIVEPSYQSAPHIGSDRPNDNHAPLAIGWGEEFLRRTYQAVIANQKRWKNTLMVVYYDEHGGFYDHVPPPAVPYTTVGGEHSFASLGPRVPAILVSPLVEKKSVSNALFDHTSVLQLLAERFTPGQPYSNSVDQRKKGNPGIQSLSVALTNEKRWKAPDAPSQPIEVHSALGRSIQTTPDNEMTRCFEEAAMQMLQQKPAETLEKYPELLQWKMATEKARS
jgi:phospholipase C